MEVSGETGAGYIERLVRMSPALILSTNVAEVSVTIPNVSIVMNSGLKKEYWWGKLYVMGTSRREDLQRQGRAGRTQPGVVYHLFHEQDEKNEFPVPESERCCVTRVVLLGLACGLADANKLASVVGFLSSLPTPCSVMNTAPNALHFLTAIGCLSAGRLTYLGKGIAYSQLEPAEAWAALLGAMLDCPTTSCVLLASIALKGPGQETMCADQHGKPVEKSDAFALAHALEWYIHTSGRGRGEQFLKEHCDGSVHEYDRASLCYTSLMSFIDKAMPDSRDESWLQQAWPLPRCLLSLVNQEKVATSGVRVGDYSWGGKKVRLTQESITLDAQTIGFCAWVGARHVSHSYPVSMFDVLLVAAHRGFSSSCPTSTWRDGVAAVNSTHGVQCSSDEYLLAVELLKLANHIMGYLVELNGGSRNDALSGHWQSGNSVSVALRHS